jgi:protein ImuA
MAMSSSRRQVLQELSSRIQEIESRRRRVHDGDEGAAAREMAAIDALLPDGGLVRGSLMELLATAHGSGAWTLGILMASRICRSRKALVVVDVERQLYLPGAMWLGLELDRAIVVRPGNWQDAHQAVVQSLRSSAVGAVICRQEWLGMRQLRRLQIAAETGGTLAVLLRSQAALRGPSCAAVRWLVSPVAGQEGAAFLAGAKGAGPDARWHLSDMEYSERPSMRRVRVEVVRCRGRVPGQALVLEIDHETGDVHASASLAPAAVVARSARASG